MDLFHMKSTKKIEVVALIEPQRSDNKIHQN